MVSKTNIKTSIKVYNVNDLEKKKKKKLKRLFQNYYYFQMESTISRQYREIKQQQMEIQQQQIEIKRLKKEMASRDEAAKRCIQQRSNEVHY